MKTLTERHLAAVKAHHTRLAKAQGPDFWAGGSLRTKRELRRLNAKLEKVALASSLLQLHIARALDCMERGV